MAKPLAEPTTVLSIRLTALERQTIEEFVNSLTGAPSTASFIRWAALEYIRQAKEKK